MRILALDTATPACSTALLTDDTAITREIETERGHAEYILGMIDAVLSEGRIDLRDVDALAFGRGPGAFTGVRLATSVAQGLAFGAELPVVPISDLAAVAQRAFDQDARLQHVLVCNDARMQEVYWRVSTAMSRGLRSCGVLSMSVALQAFLCRNPGKPASVAPAAVFACIPRLALP